MNAPEIIAPWAGRIFSNGWRVAKGGASPVKEPATGNTLGSIGIANAEDIDVAVTSAANAQPAWAALTFDKRAEIVRTAAALLRERAAESIMWNTRECGSIQPKGEWEVGITYEQMMQAAGLAGLPNGAMFPSNVPGRTNLQRRVPMGVVGVIAPWNFPLFLSMRSVAPALVLGNAVILKPDVHSAVTGGALLAALFEDAGLPAGVLHVLAGGAATGEALVRHPGVDMISFTGSTAVGREIGEYCGRKLKKTTLELGGNNAIIVAPGAAATISPADMDLNADLIGSAKIFVTQLEQPLDAAKRALEIARAGGAVTVLNPAPAQKLDASVFRLCDYVTPNETETEILTGLPVTSVEEARVAAGKLLEMGVKTAIITLGAQGALYHSSTESVLVPAFKAGPVVETTGAGDAFNGGFAAALSKGMAPLDAVRFGSAVAGISVTRAGTAPSMPSLAEVEALLAKG